MANEFSDSKTASVAAGLLLALVVVAIIWLVGGDEVVWALQGAFGNLSRSTENTFLPTLWEYKFHILVFGAVIGVLVFIRKMHDGPVKKH